jgi:hypothetical protein
MPKRMAPSLPLLARSLRQGRRDFEPGDHTSQPYVQLKAKRAPHRQIS